ncbi:MAG: flagellar hook basal-body protein [Phycisphaerales bacterium]
MNYGLHLSTSGALVNLHRMDVLANNLANLSTHGYKPDFAPVMQRDPVRVEDSIGFMPSSALLERLGGGVLSGPAGISFEQGPIEQGGPLDLAIEGDGFFVLRDERAAAGQDARLTRDGRFALDTSGRLIAAASGLPVLDVNDRPITLEPTAPAEFAADGTIRQRDTVIAQLQVAAIADKTALSKAGAGLFRVSPAALALRQAATGAVRQGAVEGSAVEPITAMLAVTAAGRAAEANIFMIQSQDRLMDRAINVLGRVG